MWHPVLLLSEKIFLSYCMTDAEGKSIRPSITLKKIKRLYPNLKEKSNIIANTFSFANEKVTFEEALNQYKEFLEGKEISEDWVNFICYFYRKNQYQFERLTSGFY